MLMRGHGGDAWGDFRPTLLGLLGACGAELSILKCATRVMAAGEAWVVVCVVCVCGGGGGGGRRPPTTPRPTPRPSRPPTHRLQMGCASFLEGTVSACAPCQPAPPRLQLRRAAHPAAGGAPRRGGGASACRLREGGLLGCLPPPPQHPHPALSPTWRPVSSQRPVIPCWWLRSFDALHRPIQHVRYTQARAWGRVCGGAPRGHARRKWGGGGRWGRDLWGRECKPLGGQAGPGVETQKRRTQGEFVGRGGGIGCARDAAGRQVPETGRVVVGGRRGRGSPELLLPVACCCWSCCCCCCYLLGEGGGLRGVCLV